MKIDQKLLVLFLLITLLPLFLVAYFIVRDEKRVLQDELLIRFSAQARNQEKLVRLIVDQRLLEFRNLSRYTELIQLIGQSTPGGGSGGSDQIIPFLRSILERRPNVLHVHLVSPDGQVFSSKEEGIDITAPPYQDILLAGRVNPAFNVFPFSGGQDIAALSAGPLRDGWSMIVESDPVDIKQLSLEFWGFGDSAEFLLAKKNKIGEIAFITPRKFHSEVVNPYQYRKLSYEEPITQALLNNANFFTDARDYRGNEVMALTGFLDNLDWGYVLKIDRSEALEPFMVLREKVIYLSCLAAFIVLIVVPIIAKSFADPILKLQQGAEMIGRGQLDYRVGTKRSDEIGQLSRTFDKMAKNLKIVTASRDELNREIARREKVEEELIEQKIDLEKVNKELDSFVYTASHDLRAPLRGISSFASFLEEDYMDKLDKEGQDYLKEIKKGADRMSMLIDDLLALSRLSRIKNPYEQVDIQRVIDDVKDRLSFDIQSHQVAVNIPEPLPTVLCDRIKIAEAFYNLVSNAIKFSSKNKNTPPVVTIGYALSDNAHQFYVKDNGIGIDPKYHDRIFGIFKRLHKAGEYDGTGAGLSIVKKIVEDHGGKIWIDSQEGAGATFNFTIPVNIHQKKRLGEMLVQDGFISQDQLKAELKKQNGMS